MALAYIGLGSNLGDGRVNLSEAWRRLGSTSDIVTLALSDPWLTSPVPKADWVYTGQELSAGSFTNSVGILECRLTPRDLLGVLHGIEAAMGRDRRSTVDRAIDLDLLYYDDLILNDPDLILPHPEMHRRLFVLAPLQELAPDRIHPVSGLNTSQMIRHLAATGESVRRLDWKDD